MKRILLLFFAVSTACINITSAQFLSTFAGNGSNIFNSDYIPATTASINFPEGLAVDRYNSLLICDQNNRIRVVDSNGTITTIAGDGWYGDGGDSGLAFSAQVNSLRGIVINTNGAIYFS